MVFEESVVLGIPFAEALAATKAALAAQGFGVLTEIDMQQTLKAKVDKTMDPYVILGACNPKLASAALDVEPNVGVLLPCNVVVRQVGDAVQIDALDPGLMVSMTSLDELGPIAAEARRLMGDALASLAAEPRPDRRDRGLTPIATVARFGGVNDLSHHDAQRVLAAAQAELDRTGRGAAVAVVDHHGELVAFVRTDGCRLPSIAIAINKAFTAARERTPSKAIGDASRTEGFPMTNFGDPRYVGWGGGVPLVVDGDVVGAIGVSGLPEDDDIAIAEAAAAELSP